MRRYVKLIHHMVMRRRDVSVDQLAGELNKRPSTLYNELNPSPGSHASAKLGIEDAVWLMNRLSDHEPLHALASDFGYRLEPMTRSREKLQPENVFRELGEVTACLGSLCTLVHTALQSNGGRFSREQLRDILKVALQCHDELSDISGGARAWLSEEEAPRVPLRSVRHG